METRLRSLGYLVLMVTPAIAYAQQFALPVYQFQAVNAKAAKGDLSAQVCLGDMYSWGAGTPRDYGKALQTYQQAAKAGSQDGATSVAEMYLYGLGVTQDFDKGMSMLKSLVDSGYSWAAAPIGQMYYGGDHVKQDYAEAYKWLSKAAAGGEPFAELYLAKMYRDGLGVKQDESRAQKWLAKVASAKIECPIEFNQITQFIVSVNQAKPQELKTPPEGRPSGKNLIVSFRIAGGKAVNPVVAQSSGFPSIDDWEIQAVQRASFPAWPKMVADQDRVIWFALARDPLNSDFPPPLEREFAAAVAAAIKSTLVVPDSPKNDDPDANDVVDVMFNYKDGRVSDTKVRYSSDEKADDAALLEAVAAAHYPPTPAVYAGKVLHLTMEYNFNSYTYGPAWARVNSNDVQVQGDFDQIFAAAMRDAIRAAMKVPKSVLINGSKSTGVVSVTFDYLDGKVTGTKVSSTSKDVSYDAAGISAVEHAAYPPTPTSLAKKKLHIKVTLDFGYIAPSTVSNAPQVATHTDAPAATTEY